jgi:tRNA dimethylallyltransferase
MEREKLYERINARVDLMIEQGLVDEVKRLLAQGVPHNCTSLQAIGYKEIIHYLQGSSNFDEAVDQLKRNTRRFAKRQLTWFKRIPELTWFDVTDLDRWPEHEERIAHYVAGKFKSMTNIL